MTCLVAKHSSFSNRFNQHTPWVLRIDVFQVGGFIASLVALPTKKQFSEGIASKKELDPESLFADSLTFKKPLPACIFDK